MNTELTAAQATYLASFRRSAKRLLSKIESAPCDADFVSLSASCDKLLQKMQSYSIQNLQEAKELMQAADEALSCRRERAEKERSETKHYRAERAGRPQTQMDAATRQYLAELKRTL